LINDDSDIDSAFDHIDSDVLAVRDRALGRAAEMLEAMDQELTRLQVLQDCAQTLKSANDSAMKMLRHAVIEASGKLRSQRLAADVDRELGEGGRGGSH
jgi:hypothetical protein